MTLYASILRDIAAGAKLLPVPIAARQPGVKAVYRVSVHYGDFRARDAVTTVTMRQAQVNAVVETVYAGRFEDKPLLRGMIPQAYSDFMAALQRAKFDRLHDQDGIAPYGVDLCMVERAAGGYTHGVIFMPDRSEGPYVLLLDAVRRYLPEVLRPVT